VDECSNDDLNNCDTNATCNYLEEGFECTCNDGYKGSGTECSDVDECAGTNTCDSNASCTNIHGSYTCSCNNGYSDTGPLGASRSWKGTEDFATYEIVGEIDENYPIVNMFDGNLATFWYSLNDAHNMIIVTFNNVINFEAVKITKRPDNRWYDRYQNICLYLDSVEEFCTDSERQYTSNEEISLTSPDGKKHATEVKLIFPYQKYSDPAEVEIIYHGKVIL